MRCGFTEEDTAESLHRSGCLAALWGLALWYNKCLYSFNSFSAGRGHAADWEEAQDTNTGHKKKKKQLLQNGIKIFT